MRVQELNHLTTKYRLQVGRYITLSNDNEASPKEYRAALEIYAALNKLELCKCTECLLLRKENK